MENNNIRLIQDTKFNKENPILHLFCYKNKIMLSFEQLNEDMINEEKIKKMLGLPFKIEINEGKFTNMLIYRKTLSLEDKIHLTHYIKLNKDPIYWIVTKKLN